MRAIVFVVIRSGSGGPRKAERQQRCEPEDDRADHAHTWTSEDPPNAQRRYGDCEAGHTREQPQLAVRFDEGRITVDDRRNDGALADRVRLRQHQHEERLGEQPVRVQVAGHGDTHHHPQNQAGRDDQPAGANGSIEQRTDERRHHSKRCHREEQIQRDPASGRVRAHVEEQRTGERNRNDRFARRG